MGKDTSLDFTLAVIHGSDGEGIHGLRRAGPWADKGGPGRSQAAGGCLAVGAASLGSRGPSGKGYRTEQGIVTPLQERL